MTTVGRWSHVIPLVPLSGSGDADSIQVSGTVVSSSAKAEDSAHTSGDLGEPVLAVRNDAIAALAGTSLKYIPLTTDAVGALWTRLAPITTGAVTSVAAAAADTSLLAATVGRKRLIVANDSPAIMYLLLAAGTASTSVYSVKLLTDDVYECDRYTGAVRAIWSAASGNARITEYT